jgi:hypothetical protein
VLSFKKEIIMKKFIFLLALAPVMSFAQGSYQSAWDEAQHLFKKPQPLPTRCGAFSDFDCQGRGIGGFCLKDPSRGQTGSCQPSGGIDDRGEVPCTCF